MVNLWEMTKDIFPDLPNKINTNVYDMWYAIKTCFIPRNHRFLLTYIDNGRNNRFELIISGRFYGYAIVEVCDANGRIFYMRKRIKKRNVKSETYAFNNGHIDGNKNAAYINKLDGGYVVDIRRSVTLYLFSGDKYSNILDVSDWYILSYINSYNFRKFFSWRVYRIANLYFTKSTRK